MVTFTEPPAQSQLIARIAPEDFVDCAFGACANPALSPSRAATIVAGHFPKWAQGLIWLRNLIVGPFGLKTGNDGVPSIKDPDNLQVGDTILVFRVESISQNEIILGEDDKHLDFRISVYVGTDGYYLTTWVHRNNLFGKIYLATIMPFHKLIVMDAIRRLVSHDGTLILET